MRSQGTNALSLIGFFLALGLGTSAIAKDSFPVQARLFMASTSVKPTEMNQLLSSESLKNIDKLGHLGIEATYPVHRLLNVGMRYGRRGTTTLEPGQSMLNSQYGELSQDAILLLARAPVYRGKLFRFDVFGGVGGTNTTFEIKSANMDGKLTRKAQEDWFASPLVSYGASAGLGYKSFFFYLEGGYDHNKVSDFSRSGTISDSVNTIQLSGPYMLIGLMFDGVKATRK